MAVLRLIVSPISPYWLSQSTTFRWPYWPYSHTITFCTSCYWTPTSIMISTPDYTKQRDKTQWLRALPASFLYLSPRTQAAFWPAAVAGSQRLRSLPQSSGIRPGAVEEHRPSTKLCAIHTREVLFSVLSEGLFPSSCFVAVSSNRVLTAQHKPWCQDSEPLVEMRPAEPFWWDEARLPIPWLSVRLLLNTAGTCSQAAQPSTCGVCQPQDLPLGSRLGWASENQRSLEKLNEHWNQN